MLTTDLVSKLIAPFKWLPPTHGNILGQERGQALVRVFVSAVAALYLAYAYGPIDFAHEVPPWLVMAMYVPFSIVLFWCILRANTSPPLRRYLANLADISVISCTMILSGEPAMPLFLFYVWVTFGNGFRFSITALLVSAVFSVVGFGTVAILSEAWRSHPVLTTSVMLALIVLPLLAAHRLMQPKNQIPTSRRVSTLITSFRWLAPTGGNILGRERGQVLLRVCVSVIVTLYLIHAHASIDVAQGISYWLVFATGYVTFSVALFWRVLYTQTSSAPRRYLANLADIGAISYLMIATEELGMPLFLLYLWITFGNGFRYGGPALLVSAILSIVGFGIVTLMTEAWRSQPAFTTSVAFTPLNGILGATELLETGRRLTPDERSLMQIIRESVNVSQRQINNVLDFSKIEAGKLILERADLDLHEVITSAAGMVRPLAVQKGLRFLVRIAPETPYRLVGDPHHLRAILLNLLSNAVKFTERGQVCLEAVGRNAADPRVTVRFEVRDTGIGIAPEAISRIFESFTQEDGGTARSYGGTGLGTTIAKQLVELMGGRIGVDSVKHQGSVFWCEIPLDKQPPAEVGENLLNEKVGENLPNEKDRREALPGIRALLVSTDARLMQYYTQLLEALDGQLINVGASAEALDALARAVRLNNPVHAVLIDAALAIQEDGGHRNTELCAKTASINMPAILVSDIAPPVEQLREWGYSAVLARAAEQRLVFAALRAAPRTPAEAGQGVVSIAPWVWGRRQGVRRHLLVADDNRTNLIIVRRMLEGAGYDVDTVETGDEALERLCAGGYWLAILDMHIPGLDGIDILRRYRLLRPRSHLPIIMLTANASLEAQQKSAEAGADAYLTKPVTAADLLNEVERLIKDTQVEVLPSSMLQGSGVDEAAKASDPNILDTGVLAELDRLYHNPRELTNLIAEYEREGRVLLDKIAQACATRNHSAFCDGVNALNSNAANVGAMKLMQVCRQAEAAGIVEFMRDRQQILALMQDAFAETLVALRGLLLATPQDRDVDRSKGGP